MIHWPNSPKTWAAFASACGLAAYYAVYLKDQDTAMSYLLAALTIVGLGGAQTKIEEKLDEKQAAVERKLENIISNPNLPGDPNWKPPAPATPEPRQ